MQLDFTLCAGTNCTLRNNCRRYRGYVQAVNDNEQYVSQFINMPFQYGPHDELYCDAYIKIDKEEKND